MHVEEWGPPPEDIDIRRIAQQATTREIRDPAVDEPERMLWVAHPTPLALLPWALAALAIPLAGRAHLLPVFQTVIDRTASFVPWTQEGAEATLSGLQIGLWIPLAFVLAAMASLRLTRFELTTQRLQVCRGLILRRHDQIALHRIRDQVVKRPLMGLLLGYGSVKLITRDPSLPVVTMAWIPRARERSEEIRAHALVWKERMGYREFDSGPLI